MTTPENWGVCAIWGIPAKTDVRAHVIIVDSLRAGGRYAVSDSALARLSGECSSQRARLALTEFIRRENRFGAPPRIGLNNIDAVLQTPLPSVAERLDRLLLAIDARTNFPGQEPKLAQDDPEVLTAIAASNSDGEELWYLSFALRDQGLIKLAGIMGPEDYASLTPLGFERVAQLRQTQSGSDQAFVAMWFSPTMDSVYAEGIEPAVLATGYRPLRIDRKEHNNKIDDEIVSEIRRSRFLIADFTCEPERARGGVYFEAGLAMGLGKPVIWMCREDSIDHVHFDTRQYSHIVWSSADDIRVALARRISAVLGDGPNRSS